MILDTWDNIHQYGLSAPILRALDCSISLSTEDFGAKKIAISETDFLLLNSYITDPAPDRFMEAHKNYLDVMVMIEGEEIIWMKPTKDLNCVTQHYDVEKDVLLALRDDDCSLVRLKAGMFIILYPEDAHCPACAIGSTGTPVKKVIGKIAITK